MPIPAEFTPRPSTDCPSYNCAIDALHAALSSLKDSYTMLMDLTAVDHGTAAAQRFEVVYHLFDPNSREYLRVAVFCASNDSPEAPSVTDLWPAADWHERECYDLMGVRFAGHPDLRRILLWEGYPYHPLRKEFPLSGLDTPLPAGDVAEETGAGLTPSPMAGGPFVAAPGKTMSKREPSGKDQSWRE
jgi:NADH-quinone oxidoreductase subunit C